MKRTEITNRGARLLLLLLAAAVVGSAQMGGMRGGLGGYVGPTGMMDSSLGGMLGGSLSGMMGGGSGLTIGPDGTLYITRSAPVSGQTQSTPTTQLTAIDANGNAKWTLPINNRSASQPAMGRDGTLFVTTSDWFTWMYDWMYSRSTPQTGAAANLLVIKPGATSASVLNTVHLTGQVASAPQIAADAAGNYVVYVVTVDGFSGNGLNTTGTSGSYLYVFSPTGALKYKLQLSQGGAGMMGF